MRGTCDLPVRQETSMSGLSLAVTFRQSWCAQKTESEALISEVADAMAQAAQPGVTPELLNSLTPTPSILPLQHRKPGGSGLWSWMRL